MASDNMVSLTGNATREPELRYTTGGRAVATFGLAVNRRWQSNNEWQEEVSFFNVTCWANLAENICQSIAKGDRVVVAGRLQQRSWETNEGEKRSVVEIVADEVAASLRWATVEIARNEREKAGNEPASPRQPDPVYGDEEPF